MTSRQLDYDSSQPSLLMHRAFRYPAKFHPPVAKALIDRYSRKGDVVLDPFCGSGTLLLEGVLAGRNTIGHDVDPLAVFVTNAKLANYQIPALETLWSGVVKSVSALREMRSSDLDLIHRDLSESDFQRQKGKLELPAIPNLDHWFRKYVQLDLARLATLTRDCECTDEERAFLELVFASIIRRSSNADPVPVSGLEVTAHMLKKEAAGRLVDPLSYFVERGAKLINAAKQLAIARPAGVTFAASLHDARVKFSGSSPQAIITSPPYQNAVDYYRRHQLEMFWLGLTKSQADRLALLPRYVGRAKVPLSDPFLKANFGTQNLAQVWHDQIAESSESRARDFKVYFSSMTAVFSEITEFASPGADVVLVVGRSRWGQVEIPTEELFKQLVPDDLELSEHLTYEIKNRSMSYARRNGANINEEHVLAFKKTGDTSDR